MCACELAANGCWIGLPSPWLATQVWRCVCSLHVYIYIPLCVWVEEHLVAGFSLSNVDCLFLFLFILFYFFWSAGCAQSWHVGALKSKQFAKHNRVVNYRRRILFY